MSLAGNGLRGNFSVPTLGDLANLKAFAIVILGGLGNLAGAALGGFALALVEEFGAGYISTAYRDAIGFLVILLIMIVRPQGLFAGRSHRLVDQRPA